MVDIEIPSTPTTDPHNKKKHRPNNKKTNHKPKANKSNDSKTTTGDQPLRTTGMALLESLTAKKAAQDALIKSAKPKVHVSFDDDGEVVAPTTKEESTDDNKKRKQPTDDDQVVVAPKKEKKKKGTHHLQGPSDKKKQESLAYLQVFVDNRSQWKFGKKQQSWLLQHIYDTEAISTEDFDRLLVYLKDLMGNAREKTLKDAQTICQETKGTITLAAPIAQVETNTFDDFDDFDAEKLLAASTAPAPPTTIEAQINKDDTVTTTDDTVKLDRAKEIVRTLM
ncbi:hypothetical protein BC941DRAFT_437260 [Chlamydoabsidia padenii]|nr:hypothetical protein BC941DRAFT_437260 [Chlamydoabsidia padenii]